VPDGLGILEGVEKPKNKGGRPRKYPLGAATAGSPAPGEYRCPK